MNSLLNRFSKGIAVSLVTACAAFSAYGQDIVAAGATPQVFTQAGVVLQNNEEAPSFSPDGTTLYVGDDYKICSSKWVNGQWAKPTVVSFSGQWKDWDPFLSADGKRIIFVSNRPLADQPQNKPQKNHHLWYADLQADGSWSAPRHFESPVNIDGANDYGPSMSSLGTICFCSRNRNGNAGMRGYYTKWLGDHYDTPKLLALNGGQEIFDPYIAPDESYIIFASNNELYISYRHNDGWLPGQKLGPQVNNGNGNGDPYVSPDGKMLYYSQDKAPGIMMVPVNIPKGT